MQTPFYSVRFNVDRDISEKNVRVGDKVFYAPDMMEFSNFVFVAQLKKYVQLSVVKEIRMGWGSVRSVKKNIIVKSRDADQLHVAQLVEHQTAVREVADSNLGRTNTQGLKITEENVLPL